MWMKRCAMFFFVVWTVYAQDYRGPVVVPVILELDFDYQPGQDIWAEIAYQVSPNGEVVAYEPAERIWWLGGEPVLLLGATGGPVPASILRRGTAWIEVQVDGQLIADKPIAIFPRAKQIRLDPDSQALQHKLSLGLPGVDGSYLAQVANFLAGNLASLAVTGTSYSVSGFGTVIDNAGDWVGGNLNAMGTVISDGSVTINGSNDRITAGSGTLDFDDDHLITSGNIGVGTTSPSEALTLNGGRMLQTFGDLRHEGAVATSGTFPRSVYVQGNYAYVGVWGGNALNIIDLQNPSAPTIVGTLVDDATTALASPTDVVVHGNLAYLTSSSEGFEIVDVSDPSQPVHLSSLSDTPTTALGGASALKVVGSYAYVTSNGESGLQIIDVSNPRHPKPLGAIFDDGTTALSGAINLDVCGSYAYVTGPFEGVEILDISDPRNPVHVGALFDDGTTNLDRCREIVVSGPFAYVSSTTEDALTVLDVSDPTAPMQVGTLIDDGTRLLDSPRGITLVGNLVFVASDGDNGISVIDVSDPTAPVEVASIADDATTELAGAYDVVVAGNFAYAVGNTDSGFEVLNLTGITVPTVNTQSFKTGTMEVKQSASVEKNLLIGNSLRVDGNASVLGTLNSTRLMQMPGTPAVVAILDLGSGFSPSEIAVSGPYAYVIGTGSGELRVVDLTDPYSPEQVGSLMIGGSPRTAIVRGRYLYVTDVLSDDLKVIDIINPNAPQIAGSISLVGIPIGLDVVGRYAYVTDTSSDDLKIIDISDPSSPSVTSSVPLGSEPYALIIQGAFAYVVDPTNSLLRVVDVSDSTTPIVVGTLNIGSQSRNVAMVGRYAYITRPGELRVIDVSDPSLPSLASTLAVPGSPNRLFVSGGMAYVLDVSLDALWSVNVSRPSDPVVAGFLDLGDSSSGIAVNGQFAYVVDSLSDELRVIDLTGTLVSSLTAHSAEVGRINIKQDLNAQGQVSVAGGVNIGSGGLYSDGNVGVSGTLALANDIAPNSSPTNLVQLYAEDVAASSELKVRDEAGNITTLSPHNFTLMDKSEPMAWSFYSQREGRVINVDMLRAMRILERVSGEKLVYMKPESRPTNSDTPSHQKRIEELEYELARLKSLIAQDPSTKATE